MMFNGKHSQGDACMQDGEKEEEEEKVSNELDSIQSLELLPSLHTLTVSLSFSLEAASLGDIMDC